MPLIFGVFGEAVTIYFQVDGAARSAGLRYQQQALFSCTLISMKKGDRAGF